ncbi:MAG: 3-hydroxyacyl-CoA dehydrogenase NAD-binding domain-containing protein [Marmoricola sp.]
MSGNMFEWDLGEDRVLVLTMNDPDKSANTMNDRCIRDFAATLDRLEAELDTFDGVILTSAKDAFFAGGDLNMLMNAGPDDLSAIAAGLDAYKSCFRRLETLGKPVVAAINGTALGGGFEFALATHHRIALDSPGSRIGLPEVTLGLLPGAGGVTRTVRLLGVVNAILNVVGRGQRMRPSKALEVGIVDEVVATADEMHARARAWITENPDAAQPWDRKGYKIPGGTPASPGLAANLPAFPANIRKQLKGAPMPAPVAVLAVAVEGAQVDLETAFAIETRYCAGLVCGKTSGNMIKALFFDMNEVSSGSGRPTGIPRQRFDMVAVLGAGMMGAAIAYVVAMAGVNVVLRDVTTEAAERGKGYARHLLDDAVAKGRLSESTRAQVLDRIVATDNIADIKGADLVIEAVFEDLDLKRQVLSEAEEYIATHALIASNTSALPLSEMAHGLQRPGGFVGMHFFSPVDKMQLLEIVVGESTSEDALARALDFAGLIGKVPIVVKDVYAFYANRVIFQFMEQALAMLSEGANPSSIEQAATQAGFPVGALALLDEINLLTVQKIYRGFEQQNHSTSPARTLGGAMIDRMVGEFGRPGRARGAGFYDYAADGGRVGLWPALTDVVAGPNTRIPFEDMVERLLIAAAVEAAHCFEDGVVSSVAEANVGSILGIGYPVWTGGALQYINQYEGGPAGFVARADALNERYGPGFEVPQALRDRATMESLYV